MVGALVRGIFAESDQLFGVVRNVEVDEGASGRGPEYFAGLTGFEFQGASAGSVEVQKKQAGFRSIHQLGLSGARHDEIDSFVFGNGCWFLFEESDEFVAFSEQNGTVCRYCHASAFCRGLVDGAIVSGFVKIRPVEIVCGFLIGGEREAGAIERGGFGELAGLAGFEIEQITLSGSRTLAPVQKFAAARELVQVGRGKATGERRTGEAKDRELGGWVRITLKLRTEDTARCGQCEEISSGESRGGRNTRYFTSWLAA